MEQEIDVRAIRAALNMTQAQLGDVIGVDQSTVSYWENGKRPGGAARKVLASLAKKGRSASQPSENAK